ARLGAAAFALGLPLIGVGGVVGVAQREGVGGIEEDAFAVCRERPGLVGVGGAFGFAVGYRAGDARGADRAAQGRVAGDAGKGSCSGGVIEVDLGVGCFGVQVSVVVFAQLG